MAEETKDRDETLVRLEQQKSVSETQRSLLEQRWVRSIKICRGIFQQDKSQSDVRKREKTYYRKVWSSIWRLVATMYQAYLKDPDNFNIEGRDVFSDPAKARVLEEMVRYRYDQMHKRDSLFIKLIWGFWDIFKYGACFAKLTWLYKEDNDGNIKVDRPHYVSYPPEQVFPDLSAETEDEMRFCHFLNYMTKEDLEALGFTNIEDMEAVSIESNPVRDARFMNKVDPLGPPNTANDYGTPRGGIYAEPGKYGDREKDREVKFYRIYESFWLEGGELKFGFHNDFKVWAKKEDTNYPVENPYGDKIPLIFGLCLTEPHELIGEGLPEPLEAAQESYNYFMNMRKDNIAISLTGHTFVERGHNTDLQSLRRRRTGAITLTDNLNTVKHEQVPDVTSSAYTEAGMDEAMMDEMSGDTPAWRGQQEPEIKATTAQLNYSQSNLKMDLYLAMVGKTYMSSFFNELTRQIQMFESDPVIIRIANDTFRKADNYAGEDVYDVGFGADCVVNIGVGAAGREMEIRQIFLAIDRGIQTVQGVAGLLSQGISPAEGFTVPNVSALYEDLLQKIGKKDLKRYTIQLPPITPNTEGGGNGGPPPNPNRTLQAIPTDFNMLQEGSGGI